MTSATAVDVPRPVRRQGDRVAQVLTFAETRCAASGLRLTPTRRRALEILVTEGRAIGAYAVLDRLREDGFGGHPPVAYRALDFLVANGFAHRVEARNAYVACTDPGRSHNPVLLVCRACGMVEETRSNAAKEALGAAARASGFQLEDTLVEVVGLCPACAEDMP
ncbi:MAG: transcriptional repressor [Pseudomonadota bacterium]